MNGNQLGERPVVTPLPGVRCVAACGHVLGEGPFWDAQRGRLWWFDIKSRRLEWFDPALCEAGGFALPAMASAGAPRTDGRLLLATDVGLAAFAPETEAFEILAPIELAPGFRTNDGQIDPLGRFWWSTMDNDGGRRPGAVFRTDPNMTTECVLKGVHIPNTLACSADGRRLYVADSREHSLTVHAVDAAGRLSAAREFAHTRGEPGAPDGSAIDAEGFLWNVQWGAWRLVRYAPDGTIDRIVALPVEQATSCAFGGPGLATLFITSAREGLSPAQLEAQPLAGGLFALDPGVAGLALPAFGD
jgi:sugar lactone lactonase YvrE